MALSPEAIIALVGVLTAFPVTLVVVWQLKRCRRLPCLCSSLFLSHGVVLTQGSSPGPNCQPLYTFALLRLPTNPYWSQSCPATLTDVFCDRHQTTRVPRAGDATMVIDVYRGQTKAVQIPGGLASIPDVPILRTEQAASGLPSWTQGRPFSSNLAYIKLNRSVEHHSIYTLQYLLLITRSDSK